MNLLGIIGIDVEKNQDTMRQNTGELKKLNDYFTKKQLEEEAAKTGGGAGAGGGGGGGGAGAGSGGGGYTASGSPAGPGGTAQQEAEAKFGLPGIRGTLPSGVLPSRKEISGGDYGLDPFTRGAPSGGVLGTSVGAAKLSDEGNLSGSAYLQETRKWVKDELDADPGLKRYVAGVITHEERGGKRANVYEALVNRVNFLRSHGHPNMTMREYLNGPGRRFYGPIQSGKINEAYLRGVDHYIGDVYKEMESVHAGRNVLHGLTDQGGPGDPNYGKSIWIDPQTREGYGDVAGAARWRMEEERRVAGGGTRSADRASVNRGMIKTVKVDANGSVDIDVGTYARNALVGNRFFKDTTPERQTQMEPAKKGPIEERRRVEELGD
jgi:hypothetical protein